MKRSSRMGLHPLILFFYIFIALLVIFFGIALVKVAFSPVCANDIQKMCVIDRWSLVGILGGMFGVSITVVTALGAIAVVYWWTNLDTRVAKQASAIIEKGLQEQETLFQKKVEENVMIFEQRIHMLSTGFDEQVVQVKKQLNDVNKNMIQAMTISIDPWNLELWAEEFLAVNPLSEVAICMLLAYLKEVDLFTPEHPPHPRRKTMYTAPANEPLYYWERALYWQRKVIDQRNSSYIHTAEDQIEKRRSFIEQYQRKHKASPEENG